MHSNIQNKSDTHLSRTLCWLLRHGALKEGLEIKSDGYIPVRHLLSHKSLIGKYNLADVKRVVKNNSKQRFSLRNDDELLEICANQGHTVTGLDNLELVPIIDPKNIDVIHGTYYRNWENIKNTGINRMKRNHIHFAIGLPDDNQVISGIRQDADIFIYINLKLALAGNLKFYKSVNKVILSPGDDNGTILPKYFLKVVDKTGKSLLSN